MDKAQVGGGKDLEMGIENRGYIGGVLRWVPSDRNAVCVLCACMFSTPFLGGRGEKRDGMSKDLSGKDLDAMCIMQERCQPVRKDVTPSCTTDYECVIFQY